MPSCPKKSFLCLLVILLRALGYAESKAPVRSQIHEFLAAAHANGEFSGIEAVRQHGATVFQESFGYADYENNLAITSDTRFEIASVTKTFTASGILLLRDRGRLTLDDPVSRYLPDFPNGDYITIKNLLLHTSGLGELPSTAITEDESLPDVVAAIGKQPVYFAPGSSDRYSNSGYVLLAAIIEKAAGEPYQTFVERELFSRAGMTRTGNYSVSEIVAGRTRKYRPGPPPALVWNVPSRSLSSTMGAGSASSTATDLLLWLAAIRNQKIFQPREGEYPYGWGRRNYFEQPGLEQTGLHEGASAAIITFSKADLDVVCLANLESGFFNRCAKDVAAIVLGKTISPIQVWPAVAVRSAHSANLPVHIAPTTNWDSV